MSGSDPSGRLSASGSDPSGRPSAPGADPSRRPGVEAVKFAMVVLVATVIAFVAFFACVHGLPGPGDGILYSHQLSTYLGANALALGISYRGSRSWAFRHRHVIGATGGRVAFFVINAVSLAIPLGLLGLSRYVFRLHSDLADGVAAFALGLPLATAARFWATRKFVFLHPEKARRKREETEEQPTEIE